MLIRLAITSALLVSIFGSPVRSPRDASVAEFEDRASGKGTSDIEELLRDSFIPPLPPQQDLHSSKDIAVEDLRKVNDTSVTEEEDPLEESISSQRDFDEDLDSEESIASENENGEADLESENGIDFSGPLEIFIDDNDDEDEDESLFEQIQEQSDRFLEPIVKSEEEPKIVVPAVRPASITIEHLRMKKPASKPVHRRPVIAEEHPKDRVAEQSGGEVREEHLLEDKKGFHGEHYKNVSMGHGAHHNAGHGGHHGVKVASFKFDYVKAPLVLAVFIVMVGLFKILYHHSRVIQRLIPESCCLILMGTLFGFLFLYDETQESISFLQFDSKTFFLYLLPPIILESAFSLRDKAFIDNLGTIVLYAVVGTVMNIAIIGGFLVALSESRWISGFYVGPLDCLVFASLIAAVDPVAVLAIFQEVGVNKMLYFMVFGESLLNDAVTVVVYNLVIEFKDLPTIAFGDCFLGFIAFLCVALGGLSIGIVCGIISAFITRFTRHVRVVEPVVVFGMAYLSYVCSELFHFSGIIGIIACGLFQAHYTCTNISSKTFVTVNYFAKVLSSVSESLIFIILGVMLVNGGGKFWSHFHLFFSIYSVLLCIVARVFVVFFLTYIVNQFTGGVRYISFNEQFIMAYGGLRGAVSFSLAFMITGEGATKNIILSATYIVILFTVFVQGCTIKPLVTFLDIRLAKREENFRLFMEFNKGMVNNMMQGMEDLCGYKGNFSWITFVSVISKRFLRPLLHKNYIQMTGAAREDKLVQLNHELNFRENLKTASRAPVSFKRQQTIDEMTEKGEMPPEILDEEELLYTGGPSKNMESVSDLTRSNSQIRMLVQNPLNDFYHDRSLLDEDAKEERRRTAMEHLQRVHRQARLDDMTIITRKKNIFGKQRAKKKMSISKGMLAMGLGAIGVGEKPTAEEVIPEEKEGSLSMELDDENGDETAKVNGDLPPEGKPPLPSLPPTPASIPHLRIKFSQQRSSTIDEDEEKSENGSDSSPSDQKLLPHD